MEVETEGEEETHSERDAEDVVDTCPDEIASDDGEDGSGEVKGSNDVK